MFNNGRRVLGSASPPPPLPLLSLTLSLSLLPLLYAFFAAHFAPPRLNTLPILSVTISMCNHAFSYSQSPRSEKGETQKPNPYPIYTSFVKSVHFLLDFHYQKQLWLGRRFFQDTKGFRMDLQSRSWERRKPSCRRRSYQVIPFLIIISIPLILFLSRYCSYSISFTATGSKYGGYINPESLMFVRQHLVHTILFPLSSMAINFNENTLLLRESESFEIEDDPAPELDKALGLTLAGKSVEPLDRNFQEKSSVGDPKNKGTVSARGKRNMAEGPSNAMDIPRPKRGRPSTTNRNA